MSKYIDADRYCANLREMKTNEKNTVYEYYDDGIDLAISEAAIFPAADVQEVRHGRWINGKCSACGGHAPIWAVSKGYYKSNYCPYCGARMEETP